jgi:hypothetical protein
MRTLEDWWSSVLEKDKAYERSLQGDDERHVSPNPILRCVFCGGDLHPTSATSGMLAWWLQRSTSKIVAVGLYHNGTYHPDCVGRAQQVDGCLLLEMHVERVMRDPWAEVMPSIAKYETWDARALRRLVLIAGAISCLKT